MNLGKTPETFGFGIELSEVDSKVVNLAAMVLYAYPVSGSQFRVLQNARVLLISHKAVRQIRLALYTV